VDARNLPELAPRLARLPRIVIDHLGLSAAGLPHLLALVGGGAYVKATGFGRGDLDVPTALRRIAAANPDALLFGTDLPSTRAARPFAVADVQLLKDALDRTEAARALWSNALRLYRPRVQEVA
jgi:predicted TIM-barrel fold metal-dependent hydrolase